jgi:hypothetical protein
MINLSYTNPLYYFKKCPNHLNSQSQSKEQTKLIQFLNNIAQNNTFSYSISRAVDYDFNKVVEEEVKRLALTLSELAH